MQNFSERSYLITGATGGIGRVCALSLAQRGASLVLVARDSRKLSELEQELPGEHRSFSLDLAEPRDLAAAFPNFVEKRALSGMVYCAGTMGNRPLSALRPDALRAIMDLNFSSFLECCRLICKNGRYALPCSIVGISSVCARQGNRAETAYCASKAAMDAAVRCIAKEVFPKGIRVNTVLPGLVRTPLFDQLQTSIGAEQSFQETLSRQYLGLGEPEDVANAVLFLLSDSSKWISGTALSLDGGRLST